MPFLDSTPTKQKKLLIITSSGGGGLIQAAVAKEQEAKSENPEIEVVVKDLLKDWMGKRFGAFCISYWNGAQRNGRVGVQVFGMRTQWIFDIISWPRVFLRTLQTLLREDVDRVIDTQNMCTSAIIKAIRIFNKRKSKGIRLEKVIVDLPTKQAIHYFRSIKALSKKDKRHLRLTTIPPLLEEGQTSEDFWRENCGLSENEVCYEGYYIRQSFRKLQGLPKSEEKISLKILYKNQEELELMKKTFERGKIKAKVGKEEVSFSIAPQDKVITLLLGSQPSNESTVKYVKRFIELAKEARNIKNATHLFVFCSDHLPGENSLFRKVSDAVEESKDYPSHFSVVPFSFQKDDVIATLFHRSDATCTRSGGQTAMELMAVSSGEMWIHSEAKKGKGDLSLEELLAGIPGWESASARYLHKIRGGKIVTPETFIPHARSLFESGNERSSPMRDLESTA